MIDEPRARELAEGACDAADVVLGPARELNEGWFFPCVAKGPRQAGVIVNKRTGRVLQVSTHTPMERDPTLYDRGYQFEVYDLVVLTVEDLDETVRTAAALHEVVRDTYYRYGRVWRVGRGLTEAEIRERLSRLPAVFTGRFDHVLDRLEEARVAGWFTFEALEYRGRD